jgi:hypothetical protein
VIKFVTVPSGAGIEAFADGLDIRAVSVDIPRATLLPIQIDIRGHRYFVPGDTEFQPTLTLTLIETDDMNVLDAMNKWREFAYETMTGYKEQVDNIKADLKLFPPQPPATAYMGVHDLRGLAQQSLTPVVS